MIRTKFYIGAASQIPDFWFMVKLPFRLNKGDLVDIARIAENQRIPLSELQMKYLEDYSNFTVDFLHVSMDTDGVYLEATF